MSYVYDVTYNKSQKKERIQDVNVLCSITVKISGSEKKIHTLDRDLCCNCLTGMENLFSKKYFFFVQKKI